MLYLFWLVSRHPFFASARICKRVAVSYKFCIFISISTRAAVNMDHMEFLLHLWCIYAANLIFFKVLLLHKVKSMVS